MALIKLNNRAVKDATAFGSISSLGSLTFISTQTASGDASISFTTGIDSTYKEYMFIFNNIHPATDNVDFSFQASTDGGSSYGVTMTTTAFISYHNESGSPSALTYNSSQDLAQSTSFQSLVDNIGNGADESCSGSLTIYNPSSNTFVKHFLSRINEYNYSDFSREDYVAGYFNDGSNAINAVQFKFESGNIDDGTISLFGIA
jgi:hypothetical protein